MTDEDQTYEQLLTHEPPGMKTPDSRIKTRAFVEVLGKAAEREGLVQVDTICAKIVKDLKGRVSADTIRNTLPSRYKNQVMMQRSQLQKPRLTKKEVVMEQIQAIDLQNAKHGDKVEVSGVVTKIRPTANILRGAIRDKPPQEVVMDKKELDEAVIAEMKTEMEEDKKRIYDLHADVPKPVEVEDELTESDKKHFKYNNNHGMQQQEVVLRAGRLCEDAARILLRSRPYNEIYFRIRRGTNVVDMVESDADRVQNKTKWMGVTRH